MSMLCNITLLSNECIHSNTKKYGNYTCNYIVSISWGTVHNSSRLKVAKSTQNEYIWGVLLIWTRPFKVEYHDNESTLKISEIISICWSKFNVSNNIKVIPYHAFLNAIKIFGFYIKNSSFQ